MADVVTWEADSVGNVAGRDNRVRNATVAAILLEALVVAAYGLYLAFETLTAQATERVAAVFLVLVVLGLAAGLALAARGVLRRHRAARAPVLVWQVLQIAVAAPAVRTRWYVGVPLILLAIVAASGVLRSEVLPEGSATEVD